MLGMLRQNPVAASPHSVLSSVVAKMDAPLFPRWVRGVGLVVLPALG